MGNQAGIIIRNVKNELFHSAKRLILNEVKGIECLPLMPLYTYYLNGDEDNHDYAVEEAGKAAGRLFKEELINDKRTFETEEGYTRMYRWTGA